MATNIKEDFIVYILLNEIYSSFSEVQAVGIDGTSKKNSMKY